MTEAILRLQDVSLTIDGISLLKQICFDVQQGSFTGLIGPNGAGKTSLLRCIYRYFQHQNGSILLDGMSVDGINPMTLAEQIAVVVQESGPVSHLRLYDVISLGLLPGRKRFNTAQPEDETVITAAAARLGLEEKLWQRFDTLSGGERQRGQLARALVRCPKLLILDEPTNHLDVRYQHEMLAMLKALEITTLATIHDLNLAAAYCDQVVLLNEGEVEAKGSAQVVLTQQRINQVFGVNCAVAKHPFYATPHLAFAPGGKCDQT